MAQTEVRQSKLRRAVLGSETTVGTVVDLTSAGVNIPAIGEPVIAWDRGTGVIPRANTADGRAGSVRGAVGSKAGSFAIECEVQAVDTEIWLPWVRLFLGCGHAADVTTGTGTVVLTPSTAAIAAFTGSTNDQAPGSLTLASVYDTAGVADSAEYLRGCTGAARISWDAGDRLRVAAACKGLVVGSSLIDISDTNLQNVGTWTQGLPLVAVGATLTLTDTSDAQAISAVDLASFTLDSGASVPDVAAYDTYGFGVSPVLFNDAPTVEFQIASTAGANGTDKRFVEAIYDGRLFSLTAAFAAGGNTVTISVPYMEVAGAPRADADGKAALTISARCVRATLGDSAAPYSITYIYDSTP
jgi:hypothetical protein